MWPTTRWKRGERILPFKAPDTGRKIAVLGGGVQGLSTAFFLARLGHAPTVLEATQKLGGLLRSAIATNRLPHDVLDWDIDGIIEMGVAVQTGRCLGKDIAIHSLLNDGFEAVFLSLGGWDSRLSRGAEARNEKPVPGLYLLMDMIKALKQKTGPDSPCGKQAIFIGGGELALQTAILCKENGADEATVIFRGSSDENRLSAEAISQAGKKGVPLIFGAGINSISGEKDQLHEVAYFEQASGTLHTLPADTLVIASGRIPELIFTRPAPEKPDTPETPSPAEEEVTEDPRWIGFYPLKHPHYNHEMGLLAEGDALSDFSGAIKAIGAGRRAGRLHPPCHLWYPHDASRQRAQPDHQGSKRRQDRKRGTSFAHHHAHGRRPGALGECGDRTGLQRKEGPKGSCKMFAVRPDLLRKNRHP